MVVFGVSLVCAATAVAVLVPALRRWQIIDVPNARSSHAAPVPRGGGIGVLVGVAAGVLAARVVDGSATGDGAVAWVPLLVALVMGVLGLVDDMSSLAGSVRLAVQAVVFVVASWLVAGAMSGSGVTGWVFVPCAAFVCVGFVNAFNFMDGINGISSLNAIVAGVWFAWVGTSEDVAGLVVPGLALAGAVAGLPALERPAGPRLPRRRRQLCDRCTDRDAGRRRLVPGGAPRAVRGTVGRLRRRHRMGDREAGEGRTCVDGRPP